MGRGNQWFGWKWLKYWSIYGKTRRNVAQEYFGDMKEDYGWLIRSGSKRFDAKSSEICSSTASQLSKLMPEPLWTQIDINCEIPGETVWSSVKIWTWKCTEKSFKKCMKGMQTHENLGMCFWYLVSIHCIEGKNLQETPIFGGKKMMVSCRFSL